MGRNASIKPSEPPERERWSSRAAFYFAAVGSAVGFGNVWRFPALVYEYGGGAFFVPYLLALSFVGWPILVLEISLGQYYETGDVEVFGGINRRLRGVGLSSIACGYMIVTYYSM
jgi:SNF family Na+-dependent transporter